MIDMHPFYFKEDTTSSKVDYVYSKLLPCFFVTLDRFELECCSPKKNLLSIVAT